MANARALDVVRYIHHVEEVSAGRRSRYKASRPYYGNENRHAIEMLIEDADYAHARMLDLLPPFANAGAALARVRSATSTGWRRG